MIVCESKIIPKVELCPMETEHLVSRTKKSVHIGCPYCNLDNYGNVYGDLADHFDKKIEIKRGFLVDLNIMYNSDTGKFCMVVSGQGEAIEEISFCPYCGRKLVKE